MYAPSLKEFLKFSKRCNVIPVYKEINADLDTPVSAFLKIKKSGDVAFLLESVEGGEQIARYSFLGNGSSLIFKSKAKFIQINYPREKRVKRFVAAGDPLEEIKRIMHGFKALHLKGLPRFYGGLVGYLAYDFVRFFENVPDNNVDDLKLPDAVFMLTNNILVFDHINHTIKIISNVLLPAKGKKVSPATKKNAYACALSQIENIHAQLKRPLQSKGKARSEKKKLKVSSNFTKNGFQDIIAKGKRYIKKGDIIQVVLSQRFKVKSNKSSFDIYRDLRSLNPSPYMFFLDLKDVVLIGSSPEMLLRCEDNIVETRPIAGTRPRGRNEEEDRKMEAELIQDKKEKAEHIMLVDLGRNDLGRVSKSGKVKVSEFMGIEKYSHVMHLVSEVKGVLDRRFDAYDVLRAGFPAGTVSGSPKIRAMEIIDELENTRRGPYAGCVGYLSFSHNLDTCITLRTIVKKDDYCYVQAGAGIVADSVPEKEYYESVNKAKALIEAIAK
jgi:anthranilate synthase component 1